MTREQAKEICEIIETHGIELIKAYGEGKIIQHLNLDGEWVDCDMPISFSNNNSFRIKPELLKESKTKSEIFPEITLPKGSAEFVDNAIADAEKTFKGE